MSLLMNTLPTSAMGPSGCRTEQRPRTLLQPNTVPDTQQELMQATGKMGAVAAHPKPYSKPHGDTLPQEPPFHRTWSLSKKRPHIVAHPHPKPWSLSSCPGKKETPEGQNPFHRVWLMEQGQRGRWNKQRKNEFYKQQDEDMQSKIPHDQKFCKSQAVYKTWTHLQDGGLKAGGQEKLNYNYAGPNTNTLHFYRGKFSNVKHVQRIVQTGYKDPSTDESRELHRDTRPMFDNRLHDDAVNMQHQDTKFAAGSNFDLFRPLHTLSCPQLGADFVQRAA
eukprot:gb/GFBE01029774.1/.p1 GENE.gb/GFBE01029774.1/~~gb/GFBE01029774.1/.p1  ORF type:complete len:277 (+),score=47.82 gb/GFBE01029774.1/:1-831(+)